MSQVQTRERKHPRIPEGAGRESGGAWLVLGGLGQRRRLGCCERVLGKRCDGWCRLKTRKRLYRYCSNNPGLGFFFFFFPPSSAICGGDGVIREYLVMMRSTSKDERIKSLFRT